MDIQKKIILRNLSLIEWLEDDGITQKIEERDKQMEKQGRKGKKVQYKEANIQITGTLKRKNRKNREEKTINKTISLLEPMNLNFQIKRAKYIPSTTGKNRLTRLYTGN